MSDSSYLLLTYNNLYWNKDHHLFLNLLQLTQNFKNSFISRLTFAKYGNSDLLKFVNDCVPDEVQGFQLNLKDKIAWILHGLTNFPECHECQKALKRHVVTVVLCYQRHHNAQNYIFCSQACKNKNSDYRKTLQASVKHNFLDDDFKKDIIERTSLTRVSRYGQYNNMKKIEETNMKRRGVKCVFQDPEIQARSLSTIQDRYGAGITNVFQSAVIKEKSKETTMKHYGVEYASQSPEIQKKINETLVSKYGTHSPSWTYEFEGKHFDSSWELCYYIWLCDNNISFKYPSGVYFAYDCEGKTHIYFPDFIVENRPVEVKGNQFFKEDGTLTLPFRNKDWSDEQYENVCRISEAKQKCMIEHNVKILREADLQVCFRHVEKKFNVSRYMKFCKLHIYVRSK